MKVALKNAVGIINEMVDSFDFAVNESCNQWDECDVSVTHHRCMLGSFA